MRFAAIGLLLLTCQVFADENPGLTLFPHIGNTVYDEILDTDTHKGLGLGYRFDNPWGVELMYQDLESELDAVPGSDVDVTIWNLGGLYHFDSGSEGLVPYAAFGIGRADYDISSGSDGHETQVNGGFGLKWFFSERSSLRGDLRFVHGTGDDDTTTSASVGLHFALGKKPEAPAPTPVEGDADRDGVLDSQDQCPGTPTGISVDQRGCPLDDDRDGVPNYQDDCPNTTDRKARIDARGCYVKMERKVNMTLNVEFDFDSSKERTSHTAEVKKVADFMGEYPDSNVTMEGHTDSKGNAEYNKGLSERRAKTIADILTNNFGISGGRVSSKGHGESQPIATNDTSEGRQHNRRVVAVLEGEKEEVELK
jgi:OOP family OmpA-OmpF porin